MTSATMTIRLDSREKELFSEYARAMGTSASDFVRQAALERIESEIDLTAWAEARADYDADPVSYSLDEAKKMLGLA